MPDLTITALRVVLEVARHGSFTAAADTLGYTQSAISRQVGAAEAAVRSPLFERQARGVVPTPSGEVLVRHAQRILHQVAAAESEIAGLSDGVAGRLVVGAFPVAAAQWVPQAVARLRERHPGLVVELREAGSPTQLRLLRARRIDVALVARGEGLPEYDVTGLQTEPLARGTFGIAVGGNHPWADRDEVDVDELAGERWVVGAGSEPQFLAWPTLTGPTIAYRVQSWQTRLGIVAAGLAVSVVPRGLADVLPRGVRWLRVHDPGLHLDRETLVVTWPERSPAARSFVRVLQETVAASGS